MKVEKVLAVVVFLMLSLFATKAYGDGGVILQPVQTPASGQAYTRLEKVEIWLVYNPDSIRHCEVKAVIDGKEIALSLKNITFCENWQMPAEVWAANISLSPGEHTCQYFYVQSVKQSGDFWADFNIQTTTPFKFYIVGEEQPNPFLESQTQVEDATKSESLSASSITLELDVKVFGFCLLLAAGLGAYTAKALGKLVACRRRK